MDFKLRVLCAYFDAIAIVIRLKCRSCVDIAVVLRFETASMYNDGQSRSATTDHKPSNKMYNIIPVTMINLSLTNHCLHKACLLHAVHSQKGLLHGRSEGAGVTA